MSFVDLSAVCGGGGSRRTTQRIFGNECRRYFGSAENYDESLLDQNEVYSFEGLEESGNARMLQEMTLRVFVYDGTLTFALRTDNNKCFMAYRFYYDENYDGNAIESMEGRVTTGIDHVLYDTGSDHVNTKEDFRYTKPLASLSINLPLGATVTAKEYIDDEFVKEAQILITIDEEHPDLCYKNFYWRYA